jgi:uncharacterized OB-fold protein
MSVADGPFPLLDAHSGAFFEAAAEGRLLIQRCDACGAAQFYPRMHCAHCHAGAVAWVEASGRATLHTFTVVHRTMTPELAEDCPYVLAIVELEEGVRMTSRVVDVPHERLRCDMPLAVTFRADARSGLTMPLFTASEEAAA